MKNSVAQSFDDWQAHVLTNRLAARLTDEDEFLERAARARRVKAPRAVSFAEEAFHSDRPGRGASSRTGEDARRGVASGSQAAVVKIASFAGGSVRIRSLLDYQSRESEIPFERESGAIVSGDKAFDELAEKWIDHNKTTSGREQEPSKDVLYFTVAVPVSIDPARAQEALAGALNGHKYAFRVEDGDEQNLVHVVASAASSAKDERNRAMRLFDNKKSINGLNMRLAGAFEGAVDVEVKRWAHGVDGTGALLCRMTRDGEAAAELSSGRTLESREANWSEANAWKKSLRSRETRDVAHVIISAKPGTDRTAFVEAARNMLGKEFAGHEYVFALHEDRKHLHVHAAVRMVDGQGQRMDPKIPDLHRWRETMAQEARLQQIPMEATSRFEKARAPAYKLSDVRMMDRGVAPESVRRRVEDVKANAIYVPVRAEGFTRAAASAAGWQAFAVAEPGNSVAVAMRERTEIAARGRGQSGGADGRSLSASAEVSGREQSPTGGVVRNLPSAETKARTLTGAEIDARWAKTLDSISNLQLGLAAIEIGLRSANGADRQELAAKRETFNARLDVATKMFGQVNKAKQEREVANIQQMKEASREVQDAYALGMQQEPHRRDELEALALSRAAEHAARIKAAEERNAQRQRMADDPIGQMSSPTMEFDTPRERSIQRFVSEKAQVDKVEEIRYSYLGADGRKGLVAFVDKGHAVVLQDSKNPVALREAMKLSHEKWGSITLTGSDSFKAAALRVAAEQGFEISNPELQSRFADEKAKVAELQASSPAGARQTPPVDAGAQAPLPANPSATTAAEREIRQEAIREDISKEARRETRLADGTTARDEHNPAQGTTTQPFVSQPEARAAREAARVETDNPSQPIKASPAESEAIKRARIEQEALQAQQETERRAKLTPRERLKEIQEENKRLEQARYQDDGGEEM